ncbi:MAG TPA: hypothetical protein VGE07_25290 [Herpetosiphonaceae bacterium]
MARIFIRWGLCLIIAALLAWPAGRQAAAAPEIAAGAAPGCASWSEAHIDCFVVGDDFKVWQISWNGGPTWGGWSSIGYPDRGTDALGGISAVSRGVNSLDVFVVGFSTSFGNVYRKTWNGSSWSSWQNLAGPGALDIYEVACTTTGANNLECFVRAEGNHLWHRSWNGVTWTAWADLGAFPSASALGGLTATTYGTGSIVVYAIGGDGHAYRRFREGGTWFAWVDDGFPTGFPLRQVGCHTMNATTIDCAFTDNDGGIWYRRWAGSWSAFTDLGYPAGSSRGVTMAHYGADYGGLLAMSNGSDGRFHRRFRDPGASSWGAWINQGRPTDMRVFLPQTGR